MASYTEPPRETVEDTGTVPAITESDWSGYFDGMNGAAVIYDPDEDQYMIYNQELAETRRSPCSTFKIISSLIALEDGIIEPEHSVREWSGEIFWNEKWNKDIDFHEAFRTSCVWYYRQIIDEAGADRIQAALNGLLYGNCDISDWEGRLNTNNDNRALTGFWIESSLKISAKEQTQVMERIFGKDTLYREGTLEQLKQVMVATPLFIVFRKPSHPLISPVAVRKKSTLFLHLQRPFLRAMPDIYPVPDLLCVKLADCHFLFRRFIPSSGSLQIPFSRHERSSQL